MKILYQDSTMIVVILLNTYRWDQLAYAGYGDASYMSNLLAANPNIAVFNWVPEQTVIVFPIILQNSLIPSAADFPAWKLVPAN